MTGSTHANHRSARSLRPTPEEPARENPIGGPQTGTTQSESSPPTLAGASGRHNEPDSRPASACPVQPPSKAGGASPWGRERHHGVGKANWSTTRGQEARQRGTPPAQPRHTDSCQATTAAGCRKPRERASHATKQGTRTGAKQHHPPSGWTCARPAANPTPAGYRRAIFRMDECAPGSVPCPCRLRNSRRPDSRVRGQTVPSPCRLQTAAVRPDECAPRSYAPHTQHRTRNTQSNTPSKHTGEKELSGPGNRRHSTTQRACTPVKRSQVPPGHRTPNTTQRASTPVNRSQVAQDTARSTQQTKQAHQ